MDRKRNRWIVQIRPVQVKGKKKERRYDTMPLSKDKDIYIYIYIYGSEVSKYVSTEYSHMKTQMRSPQFNWSPS